MKAIFVAFLLVVLTVGCIETELVEDEKTIYPTFNIVADVNISSDFNPHASFDESEKEFAISAISYNISHSIRDMDNNIWKNPRLEFTISLIPKEVANANDKETLFFRVDGLTQRIETETGNYRLITKSGGWYHATWRSGNNIWYEDGSKQLQVLHKENLSLDFEVNKVGMSFLKPFDTIYLQIVFYNKDNTWMEYFNVAFRVAREYSL